MILSILAVLLYITLLSPFVSMSHWDLINKRGVIKFGTRTSLLSYFKSGDTIIGYEYQLIKRFAEANNLAIEPIVYYNNGSMFNDLKAGKLDLVGGHLTVTKARQTDYNFTLPISQTGIDLVTHFNYRNNTSLQDFEPTKGVILDNSSYKEVLNDLPGFAPENLSTVDGISLFELIRKINSKEIDYTFADSEIINIYQYFIPGIYQTIQLTTDTNTAFMLRKERSTEFKQQLDGFIVEAKNVGLIKQLKEKIMEHLPDIDTANTVTFFDKLQTNWPAVKNMIFTVAKQHDFDPAMLAAISYQESHWEVDAESFTGVKGLMMLTESAAQDMNIEDRTDPIQSLEGGIRYYQHMKDKLPDRIAEPHRTLFALAAYNVGFGHLEDARILTQRAGEDPDSWFTVEPFLAKLNNPSIAHELKYGNADGYTAVIYVNNIMTYRQLMSWKINKESRPIGTQPSIL